MDAQKQRSIASKGGRAAHAKGTAHEFTSDEARQAGRKGGESVSRNREHMSAIGRKGGESRGANRLREREDGRTFGSGGFEVGTRRESGSAEAVFDDNRSKDDDRNFE